MNEPKRRHAMAARPVVLELPGMHDVVIERDVEYRASGAGRLTMDIYRPQPARRGMRLPVAILVLGYPDSGAEAMLGCRFKEMESCIGWAKLLATTGLAAIVYTNETPSDLHGLLGYLSDHGEDLGLDASRIGLWACSGNVPTALSVLMRRPASIRCAALCYGYMLDSDGALGVAEQAAKWGFANPRAGLSVADLAEDVALLIARAGLDEFPRLNESIDDFVTKALQRNLPVQLVNHAQAPHAFDLLHDSATTRAIIRQILAFMKLHLSAPGDSR